MKETLDSYPEAEEASKGMAEQLDGLIEESHSRTTKLIRIRYRLASGQINESDAQSELDEIPGAY